ncbi:MAG: CAP domain-containing protein [Prevotellaceae bacterium]|jgi:hypothetical protein|nr:CAP domain-containing protein [Prevotellaceae bacterium]
MKFFRLFPAFVLCLLLSSCTKEAPSVASDPLYEYVPDIASCTPGSLSEIEKQKVLTYINSVRATHNLPAVVYDNRNDRLAQEAALIGAANAGIGIVSESDLCYSENGAQGCNTGNRSFWGNASSKWPSSEIHINDWMTELNSENINNRRRILDPFLKSITFGRVIGTPRKGDFKYVSSAMLITSDGADISNSEIQYVAYPEGNYSAKLFDPNSVMSFSLLSNKSSKSGNNTVDFSDATVEVNAGSQILNIVEGSLSYDNSDCGLPNNLQWKVVGLVKNVTYTVTVSGIKVADEVMEESRYTFAFK